MALRYQKLFAPDRRAPAPALKQYFQESPDETGSGGDRSKDQLAETNPCSTHDFMFGLGSGLSTARLAGR